MVVVVCKRACVRVGEQQSVEQYSYSLELAPAWMRAAMVLATPRLCFAFACARIDALVMPPPGTPLFERRLVGAAADAPCGSDIDTFLGLLAPVTTLRPASGLPPPPPILLPLPPAPSLEPALAPVAACDEPFSFPHMAIVLV